MEIPWAQLKGRQEPRMEQPFPNLCSQCSAVWDSERSAEQPHHRASRPIAHPLKAAQIGSYFKAAGAFVKCHPDGLTGGSTAAAELTDCVRIILSSQPVSLLTNDFSCEIRKCGKVPWPPEILGPQLSVLHQFAVVRNELIAVLQESAQCLCLM